MDRRQDPGRVGPSLSPVPATLDAYRVWLSGEPDWAAGLDDDGRMQMPSLPDAGGDWQLVSHLGWTWADLEACPVRVRQLWLGMLAADRERENTTEDSQPATEQDRSEAQDLLARARAFGEADA